MSYINSSGLYYSKLKSKITNITQIKSNADLRISLLIFAIVFTIFVFTSDAHRYSIDEDEGQQLTIHLITQKPDPGFIQGQSKMEFNYPSMKQWAGGAPCQNGVLCYPAYIGHSVSEIPFVFINHSFHIITPTTLVLTNNDFDDPHYVYWRNSLDPDFTFLQLFYGPFFSALAVGIFFFVCRTFNFSQNNSIVLTLLYGLTTTVWAYSHTSINNVPLEFFGLLGFLFFRRFRRNRLASDLIFCGTSLGFGFLSRPDAILFIIPVFAFLLYNLVKENSKLKKFFAFTIPLASSYLIYKIIDFIRYGYQTQNGVSSTVSDTSRIFFIPDPTGIFGLLLSPGVGLLIFAPILLTLFFSIPDFYKRNKYDCILFLSFITFFLIEDGGGSIAWHGLIAWGARYLLPIVPFMLLPLGASLETRKKYLFKIILPILGGLGVFFNIIYVIQDVSWFVWTYPGSHTGLFGLARPSDPLYISPATLWTFQYSQLTQSIVTAFTHLQPDIFLLKIFGPIVYGVVFTGIMMILSYFLVKVIRGKYKISLSS